MQIIINGKVAAIKVGSSFDYVSENRLFSGADGYTLSIAFPLKDCPRNLEIFGSIYRPDVDISTLVFDCEIRCRGFVHSGALTIVGVSESEVKGQFLEGRSVQNFDTTFDKVYINELDLGSPAIVSASMITPARAWDPAVNGYESVALPWVNNSSSGAPHNFAEYASGTYSWSDGTESLTWQPYLLYITKKICDALGYSHSFGPWEESPAFSRLIICNVLPESWDIPGYAAALPHWTVEEYFEKLSLFLAGEFDIDHRARTVRFRFTADMLAAAAPVKLVDVVDQYSAEIKVSDPQCDYLEARSLSYKDPGYTKWKYHSCPWFVKREAPVIKEYDTLDALIADNIKYLTIGESGTRNIEYLFYAKDVDVHYFIRTVDRKSMGSGPLGDIYRYRCILQPVNIFAKKDMGEDADEDELEFLPACIDFTETKYGDALFIDVGSFSDSSSSGSTGVEHDTFLHTRLQGILDAGEKNETDEYFSTILLAYWDGMEDFLGLLPHPHVENVEITPDWKAVRKYPFSFRLQSKVNNPRPIHHNIDPHRKTVFKFLSDTIPDVRAVFHIRGRRYICEKITATFSESGMSRQLKGEFYPLLD